MSKKRRTAWSKNPKLWNEIPYERLQYLWLKANQSAEDTTVPEKIRTEFKDLCNALVELMVRRMRREGVGAST
jgi:hypothetical protein